jgi:predicted AAA+ superfamily ATPase
MYRRNIQNHILEALADTPVVFLRGARQVGKTTLVRQITKGPYPARYVTLDNAANLSAASADPSGFIAGMDKPVVIDEAQRVPDLFLAIKEDVDRHRTPGRYLLTGSADVLTLPKVAGALAGRMEVLTLWPLSMAEMTGCTDNLVDALFSDAFPGGVKPNKGFDVVGSVIAGGFPEPLERKSHQRRQAWFESYVTTILDRDIRDLAQIQDLASVPRLLRLLAARTASLHNQSEISRSSGIPNSTLSRYMALLESTFLVQMLPAWSSNLGKRLVKTPKLFMVDTGLACHLTGIDQDGFRHGGDMAGRLFENFIVLELLKYTAWSRDPARLHHFRSQTGKEVDVVMEGGGGRVVGIEIKLSASPASREFSGLKVLREHCGEKFTRGVLFHTGREIVPFGENLYAVPVSILAGGAAGR